MIEMAPVTAFKVTAYFSIEIKLRLLCVYRPTQHARGNVSHHVFKFSNIKNNNCASLGRYNSGEKPVLFLSMGEAWHQHDVNRNEGLPAEINFSAWQNGIEHHPIDVDGALLAITIQYRVWYSRRTSFSISGAL